MPRDVIEILDLDDLESFLRLVAMREPQYRSRAIYYAQRIKNLRELRKVGLDTEIQGSTL